MDMEHRTVQVCILETVILYTPSVSNYNSFDFFNLKFDRLS
jgi:hypothetical protein